MLRSLVRKIEDALLYWLNGRVRRRMIYDHQFHRNPYGEDRCRAVLSDDGGWGDFRCDKPRAKHAMPGEACRHEYAEGQTVCAFCGAQGGTR